MKTLFYVLVFMLLAGCKTLDYTVVKKSEIDRQISAARVDTTNQLKVLNEKESQLLSGKIDALMAQKQAASNYLFKASVTFGTLKSPTRPEAVMGQSIQQTAAQLPPATAEAQADTLKALQVELDESRVTNEALKVQYEKELGAAKTDGAAKTAALQGLDTQLGQIKADRQAVLEKAAKTEQELGDKRAALSDKELADKQKDLDNAKSVQAIKMKFSAILGILTLVCIAGAIWSPVMKEKFGIAGVVFGIATAAIWWIQGWMIAVVVIVLILGLIIWAAKNHYIESKAASSTYHALQSIRDTSVADYEKVVKPALVAWQTQYTKNGSTVPDPSISAHIDSVLMSTGAK